VHAARRSSSTTPTQKLFVMNSPFIIEQSKKLAQRLQLSGSDDVSRIRHAYELLFAREPEAEELAIAQEYLKQPAESALSAWEQLAQALLATNEMLYVD
jgi:TorA maturation chaperone TorD